MIKTTAEYSLDNFVGYDYIKDDIKDIIEILQHPSKYQALGVELPKGLILSGSPGLGKTLLAKIISAQTGLKTFNINASNEKTSANKVCRQITSIFKKAEKCSPSIIILDELDRMIPNNDFTSDKSRSILSTLLTNLDGFKSDHNNIFVIATTNGWDDIDDALKRSGRLDRRITINLPDIDSREALCEYYLNKINNISHDQKLVKQLAMKINGFSCADIKKLINDSLIQCIRDNKTSFELNDFTKSIIKIRVNDIPQSLSDHDKRISAYHELGHLIVNYKLFGITSDVIIQKFDDAGGANFIDESGDYRQVQACTQNKLADTTKGYLGGRAAEELFVGDVGYGFVGDLCTIRKMWCYCYGNGIFDISNTFVIDAEYACESALYGSRCVTDIEETKFYTQAFKNFLLQQYNETIGILKENGDLIQYLYKFLIQKEFLDKDEIMTLIKKFEKKKK